MLLFVLPNVMEPDLILQVGSQHNEATIEFTKEIEDEKIEAFENWFDEINFKERI